MTFDTYMKQLKKHQDLSRDQAREFLSYILDGETIGDDQIAQALTILTEKTVTVDEVCGFIDAMRERMTTLKYEGQAIDTCGTGGDKSGTFNISTAAAILLAAGDVSVAKHGNRAATSKCGSADVLETLGIPIDLAPAAAQKALAEHGFAFLFAPLYHPALKRLITVRKSLGFPTVFNLLGPLLNPAGVKRQVIGTFSLKNAELLANVMARMGYEHALVLTSQDGLDEASLAAPTTILEIQGSDIRRRRITAVELGLAGAEKAELAGGDAEQNADIIRQVLQPAASEPSAPQRITILNAGLGFYVAGKAPSIKDGVTLAQEILQNGRAQAKLQELQSKGAGQ